jgi:hypothetical protein
MKQKVIVLSELQRANIYTTILSKRVIEHHMSTDMIAFSVSQGASLTLSIPTAISPSEQTKRDWRTACQVDVYSSPASLLRVIVAWTSRPGMRLLVRSMSMSRYPGGFGDNTRMLNTVASKAADRSGWRNFCWILFSAQGLQGANNLVIPTGVAGKCK